MITPQPCYPMALATAVLPLTTDGKYFLGQKSEKEQYLVKTEFVGGTVEVDDPLETGNDLINAANREILEEVNIPAELIIKEEVAGVLLSDHGNGIVVVTANLSIDSKEVMRRFKQNNDEELESLIFIGKKNIRKYLRGAGGYKPVVAELM